MLSPESKKRMRRTASFFQDMNKKNSELTRVIKRGRESLHKYVSNLMKSPNSPLTKRSPPKKNSPLTKRAKELGLNKAKYSPNALKRRHKELGPINNNSAFNNLVKNLGFNKPKSTKK